MLHTLQSIFGHSEFRPGQAEVIQRILAGHSNLGALAHVPFSQVLEALPARAA